MRRILLFTLLFGACHISFAKCTPTNAETRWGGNEIVELAEKHPLKALHGVVKDINGEPIGHALVELFDHPEMNPDLTGIKHPAKLGRQQRLQGCETDSSGSFELNPPPGDYELRISVDRAWNVTHYIVHVRKHGRKKALDVPLRLGT